MFFLQIFVFFSWLLQNNTALCSEPRSPAPAETLGLGYRQSISDCGKINLNMPWVSLLGKKKLFPAAPVWRHLGRSGSAGQSIAHSHCKKLEGEKLYISMVWEHRGSRTSSPGWLKEWRQFSILPVIISNNWIFSPESAQR